MHGHTVWEVRSMANMPLMWLFLKKTNCKFQRYNSAIKKTTMLVLSIGICNSFSRVAATNLMAYNKRNLYSHSSEHQKSEIKGRQGCTSSKGSREGIIFATFSNSLVWACVVLCLVTQSSPTLCDSMDWSLLGCSVHRDSPGKYTGGGCHALLQGIFPNQGSNPGLLHCRWIIYRLSHQGSPTILEWVAYFFSRGSSWPRNWTDRLFISGLWLHPSIFVSNLKWPLLCVSDLPLPSCDVDTCHWT